MDTFKNIIKPRKSKGFKLQGFKDLSHSELLDLVVRLEKEAIEANQQIEIKRIETERAFEDTENFKHTAQQMQKALGSSVIEANQAKEEKQKQANVLKWLELEVKDKTEIIEKQDKVIQKLKQEKEDIVTKMIEMDSSDDISKKQILEQIEKDFKTSQSEALRETLENQVSRLAEENKRLNETIQKQEQQLQELQHENQTLTLNRQIQVKQRKSGDILKINNETLSSSLSQSNQQLRHAQLENERLKGKLSDVEQSMGQLRNDYEMQQPKHQREMQRQKEYFDSIIEVLRSEMKEVKLRSESVEKQGVEQQQIETCQNSTVTDSQVQSLQKENNQIQVQLAEQNVSISQLKSQKLKLENELNILKEQTSQKRISEIGTGSTALRQQSQASRCDTEPQYNESAYSSRNAVLHTDPGPSILDTIINPELPKQQGECLSFLKQTKQQLNILYKELLRIVMNAPTLTSQESAAQVQAQQNSSSAIQNQGSIKRSSSMHNIKQMTTVFQINAQEFSNFEKKFNCQIAVISEFIPKMECKFQETYNSNPNILAANRFSSAMSRLREGMNNTGPVRIFACINPQDNEEQPYITRKSVSSQEVPSVKHRALGSARSYKGQVY